MIGFLFVGGRRFDDSNGARAWTLPPNGTSMMIEFAYPYFLLTGAPAVVTPRLTRRWDIQGRIECPAARVSRRRGHL